MFDISLLDDLILDTKIRNKIINSCEEQLRIAYEVQEFVEKSMLIQLNELSKNDGNEKKINYAITLLLAQGIKTFKSCILLSKEGYFTNSIINLRNIVEITFNVKYIFGNTELKYKRARDYLSDKKFWTNDKVWERAYLSLDKPLYEIYKLLCEYSHANYRGTCRNNEEGKVSVYPTERMACDTLELVNSIYYYLILNVCEYYKIDIEELDKIEISPRLKENITLLKTEKDVVDFFMNIIKENVEEVNIEEVISQFKKYTINRI